MGTDGSTWRFQMLGTFGACRDGIPVEVRAPKPRTMLALLLAHAGRVVELDTMVDEVWDAQPPPSATANVRTYAAGLRRVLGGRLVSCGTGYALDVEPHEIDLAVYSDLAATGRGELARGDHRAGMAALAKAHGMWLGRPFAGVRPGPRLRGLRSAYEYDHLSLTELYCQARLHLGEDDEIVPLLRAHVAEFPLREHAHALLMIALYRAGDAAAALAAYQRAHATLADELGIDTGSELRRIHQAILRRDESLECRGAAPARRSLGLLVLDR
ncbi:MAG TPA: BTAD domain-containing putative transcriptional regulator [Micromonosporaceae bacterium]|nr:BTAD domain-containing putative transcriptional regulator [Micromonosporaceae bacterium]